MEATLLNSTTSTTSYPFELTEMRGDAVGIPMEDR